MGKKKQVKKAFKKIEKALKRVSTGQRISFARLPDVQTPEDVDGVIVGNKFQKFQEK